MGWELGDEADDRKWNEGRITGQLQEGVLEKSCTLTICGEWG